MNDRVTISGLAKMLCMHRNTIQKMIARGVLSKPTEAGVTSKFWLKDDIMKELKEKGFIK